MTEDEAIALYERAHGSQERLELESDIQDISNILGQRPIDMYQVKTKIKKVNMKHPENVALFDLIFPPHGDRVSLEDAPDQSLINDLVWKKIYLQAKRIGKPFDEFCKEMRKDAQRN